VAVMMLNALKELFETFRAVQNIKLVQYITIG
jgi:hypothetical protein